MYMLGLQSVCVIHDLLSNSHTSWRIVTHLITWISFMALVACVLQHEENRLAKYQTALQGCCTSSPSLLLSAPSRTLTVITCGSCHSLPLMSSRIQRQRISVPDDSSNTPFFFSVTKWRAECCEHFSARWEPVHETSYYSGCATT